MIFFIINISISNLNALENGVGLSVYSLVETFVENSAPEFAERNITLQVVMGRSYLALVNLTATDQDGDSLVYLLNNGTPSGLAIGDNSSGVVSWTDVPDLEDPLVIFTASDGRGQAALVPTIKLCKCKVSQLVSVSTFLRYYTQKGLGTSATKVRDRHEDQVVEGRYIPRFTM